MYGNFSQTLIRISSTYFSQILMRKLSWNFYTRIATKQKKKKKSTEIRESVGKGHKIMYGLLNIHKTLSHHS